MKRLLSSVSSSVGMALLAAAFVFGMFGAFPAGARAEDTGIPSASAEAWAVCDMASGRLLAGSNEDAELPMASTTKIMTALIACEEYPPEKIVEITPECYAEGSSMYLRAGEKVKVSDLIYGLMLMSGNDAARALALNYAGGIDAFILRMNERAAELGLEHTSFVTPNGLDAERHCTTARELALLASAAMKNDAFRETVSSRSAERAGRHMRNHNKLLTLCDDCIGVKTGYTKRAGRCLVSAFERNGRGIIVVTLNAPDDWRDHIRLRDWAFSRFSERVLAAEGDALARIEIAGGDVRSLAAAAGCDCRAYLSDDELGRVEMRIAAPEFCYAPVRRGESCGEAVFLLDGCEIARAGLVWKDGCARAAPYEPSIIQKLEEWLAGIAEILGL